jgi:putative heme-binding domain-containing protein
VSAASLVELFHGSSTRSKAENAGRHFRKLHHQYMRTGIAAVICALMLTALHAPAADPPAQPRPARSVRDYRDFAMGHDGNVERGKQLFNDEQRAACAKCHSVDGSSGKVGPDLLSVGDKFPRPDLIAAVLEPSASIAVGYGTTIVETKAGDEITGIIKESTADALDLMCADGRHVRIATRDIKAQRGSNISLMPEGLQAALSREEFTDLIEYLTTLRQPENALTANHGMPSNIPELAKPVAMQPFFREDFRYPADYQPSYNKQQNGLTWFGQVPGGGNAYLVVNQVGVIWLIEKSGTNDAKKIFLDLTKEVFSERGPNGLLGLAFHPKFRENRKYYLKHQVMEDGKIVTAVFEREMSADFRGDSGRPSRRIWGVVNTTQDHGGGCIAFGPDGFLYIGVGDTGPQRDPQGHGQDLSVQFAKMLRIDVDHAENGLAYAIPADNPFRNRPNARPEIWAYGLREPWRFSFDSLTGDLWVGDVGQDRVEEADIIRRGENYGWNVYEGFEPFSNRYRKDGEVYTPPVFAYRRKFGNSITGGYVYRGDPKSSFYGVYICGDFTSRRVFGVKQKDRVLQTVRQLGMCPGWITSFGTDERGDIYAVGYAGMVYHLDLAGSKFDGD